MPKQDRGFSLIELMVVMMILAVLVALALVAYGRFEHRAQDADAQTALRHTMLAEQALFTDDDAYSDDPVAFEDFEPAVFINLTSASDFGVYVDKFSDDVVCLHEKGGGGAILAVWLDSQQAPQFGRFASQADADAFVCNAGAPGWPTEGWE